MKLGFITINFSSEKDTLSLVKDIETNAPVAGVDVKIYVVDNAHSTTLEEELSQFSHAVYVSSPGNVGFTGGNNLGIKEALAQNTDIICLINDDTEAPVDLVKNISSSPISDPKIGIVGGLIYFSPGFEYHQKYTQKEKGHVVWYAGGKLDWNNVYGSHIGVDEVDHGQFDKTKETDFVTGCLLITRSDVIKKVGLLDERFFLYHEDTDFNIRAQKLGYKTLYYPKIHLYHKVAQSSGIGSSLNDYFLTRNRLLLGMKYAPFRTKVALLKEALRQLFTGTSNQKQAILDFFTLRFGKGSFIK